MRRWRLMAGVVAIGCLVACRVAMVSETTVAEQSQRSAALQGCLHEVPSPFVWADGASSDGRLQDVERDAHCEEAFFHEEPYVQRGVVSLYGSSRSRSSGPMAEEFRLGQAFVGAYYSSLDIADSSRCGQTDLLPLAIGTAGDLTGIEGLPFQVLRTLGVTQVNPTSRHVPVVAIGHMFEATPSPVNDWVASAPQLMFRTYGGRGRALQAHARAHVFIPPGGLGSQWELFETLSKQAYRKALSAPVFLLGKESDWAPLLAYVQSMIEQASVDSFAPDAAGRGSLGDGWSSVSWGISPEKAAETVAALSAPALGKRPPAAEPASATLAECLREVPPPFAWSEGSTQPDSAVDILRDARCADQWFAEPYLRSGIVSIYGSSRAKPTSGPMAQADELGVHFAEKWWELGKQDARLRVPLATGGDVKGIEGVLFEALRRQGISQIAAGDVVPVIALGHLFGATPPATDAVVTGVPRLMFRTFSGRETELINRAVAHVFVPPGGLDSQWELFEVLSKQAYRKSQPAPVFLLGTPADWEPLRRYLRTLQDNQAVSALAPDSPGASAEISLGGGWTQLWWGISPDETVEKIRLHLQRAVTP